MAKGKKKAPPVRKPIGALTYAVIGGIAVIIALIVLAGVFASRGDELASETLRGASREEKWIHDLTYLRTELLAKHKNMFMFITKSDYNAGIDALIQDIPNKSDEEMTEGIAKLLHRIGDPHTYVARASDRRYPIAYVELEEGIFVDAEAGDGANLFTRVVKIGDAAPESLRETLKPYLERYTPQMQKAAFCDMLADPEMMRIAGMPETLAVTLENAQGETHTLSLSPVTAEGLTLHRWSTASSAPAPFYRDDRGGADYWFEAMPGQNAVYMQVNHVSLAQKEDFTAFVDQVMAQCDGMAGARLIVDLRANRQSEKNAMKPLVDALGSREGLVADGHVRLIIGRGTQDGALSDAVALMSKRGALPVGEATGGRPNYLTKETAMRLSNVGVTVVFPTGQVREASDDVAALKPVKDVPVRVSYLTEDDFLKAALAEDPKAYAVPESKWGAGA